MSDTTKAVFLSYASQDAEAAKKICDALRATGVEVWFDAEGGLEHGDEWDAKIRRQIKECVLFLPLISANTQAREEGYFRIEWELAAQRALGIASGVAFILPIVIDDTREPAALVPDRFRTVQWTKLPGGVVPPEVLQRFLKLWSHRTGVMKHEAGSREQKSEDRGQSTPAGFPAKLGWKIYAGVAVLAVAAVATWWLLRRPSPAAPSPVAAAGPVAPLSPQARDWPKNPELKKAIVPLDRLDTIPEDIRLAEEIAQRVLDKSPTDPEALTVMARVHSMWLLRGWDRSTARYQKATSTAERALQLAPDEPEALAALATYLYTRGSEPQRALELAQRAVDLAPQEPRFHRLRDNLLFAQNFAPSDIFAELNVEHANPGLERALASARRTVELFPEDALVRYELARHYRDLGRWAEFEQTTDATLALAPVANAIVWKARVRLGLHGDLAGMKALLDQVPARVRAIERTVFSYFLYSAFSGGTREGLDALNGMTDDWMIDFDYRGPKALLVGALLELQGKRELARLQYEAAFAKLQRARAANPEDTQSYLVEAWIQHGLGRNDEARAALRIFNESVPRPFTMSPMGTWWFQPIVANLLMGERGTAIALIREVCANLTEGRTTIRSRLLLDPRMAPFRDDPEIKALLAEPEGQKTEDRGQRPEASRPIDQKSVAVLAFANLSDDKGNEYFSDGISEELLNVLAKIPGLKVSARTSAFHFKGKDTPIPEIARQLGVAYVVEGSVRKAGDKVRITAQLIKAADGFHVWSDTFTRDLKDIFAVQDEIAGLIAKNLSLKLGIVGSVSGRATVPEAFELYVQGRAAWNLRTREGYTQAENLLKRAIDLDPGFARAHSALADVWSIAGYENESGGGTYGWRNSPTLAKIAAKAEQAVALDANCAESLTSLASALEFGWKWGEAERAYRRAIELNPNYATARHWFGMMLWVQGKMDDALAQLKRATENDPLSHRILDTHARMLNQAGRPEEALAVAERALALQPLAIQAATQKAHALVLLGRSNEAVTLLEKALAHGANTEQRTNALLILHLAGADAAMRRLVGATEELPASQFRFASLIALGRTDEALAELRPENLHEFQLINMAVMSFYDPVRENPRFLQAISEVGYLEYYRRARAWLTANLPKVKK